MRRSLSVLTACALSLSLTAPLAAAEEAPTPIAPADAAGTGSEAGTATDAASGADADSGADEGADEGANTDANSGADEGKKEEEDADAPKKGSSMNIGKTSTDGLSPECKAEVEAALKEHEDAVAAGTAGSSFMGPKEFVFGVLNGYGSSGMPSVPDCIESEQEAATQAKWDKMPEWLQSARPGGTAAEVVAWIGSIVGILGTVLNAVVLVAKANPAMLNGVRHELKKAGFKF